MGISPEPIIHNGMLLADKSGMQNYTNRGFLYGDGFFESMRYENQQLLRAEDHFQRIHRSLALSEMSSESIPDVSTLCSFIEQLLAVKGAGNYARVRLSIYRDAEGFYTPAGNKAAWMMQVKELEGTYTFPDEGLTAGIYTRQSKARGPLANIKSLSSFFYVMAAIYAQKEKWDDALVMNTSGHIIEGTSSNLFLIYNDTLISPPLSEGCIDGVFRKFILDLADRNGIPFREQIITETEINLSKEIFLTNSIRGIQWVNKIGKQVYGNDMARALFTLMMKEIK